LEAPRNRDDLAALQLAKLRAMMAAILPGNAFYTGKLQAAGKPSSLDEFAQWPFTTKQELVEDQTAHPLYGTNLTYPLRRYCRLHQTSGTSQGRPLRWLDTRESWDWFMRCWDFKFATIGLTPDDRLFFPFSFGPFIGFWAAFEGAFRLGNLCLPGGGMSSSARLRFLIDNEATIICCTPTYALRLAEVARQEGIDLAKSPVRSLIVAGEPGGSIPATRRRIEESWGARVFDHCGMTEIGSLGIECQPNPGGLHLLETECIAEVIDPGTGRQVSPGQEGELVLTNLGRWGSPLIRYRTGDRVVADPEPCPCGRIFVRLKGGILGRTDDMIFIRGNNVYPSALEDIIRRFPEIEEYRIEVDQTGALTCLRLLVETQPSPPTQPVADLVRDAIRNELNFRPEVTLVPPGTLPRPEMKAQRLVRKM
jgi:phenylacetate-CoA ligase